MTSNHKIPLLSPITSHQLLITLSALYYTVIMYLVKLHNFAPFTAIFFVKETGGSGLEPGGLAMLLDGGRGMVVPAIDYG